ncbi:ABC transporter ATP-binding protein [Spongiimicrobium sp. 3-5]|uniref:ABC transporter ATP-binding protein n=1 Tax=Spongiimicrobium sp. 3-5 TaxID=3332596 RepID=UPI003981330F
MMLEAKHIYKHFLLPQRQQILNNVSIYAEAGELVSIFGTSGSGKSTLLYILATLDTDFEGDLFIHDKNIKSLKADRLAAFRNKHIGFVYQFHYLLPEFNVLQNVMLPAMKLGEKKVSLIREEALTLLREMGMEGYSKHPAQLLSGGQQQRVAIARALINNPSILIADEPTGNLDQKNTLLIFELLREITAAKNKTVIMATHNLELQKKSDRVIEIIDGSVRL